MTRVPRPGSCSGWPGPVRSTGSGHHRPTATTPTLLAPTTTGVGQARSDVVEVWAAHDDLRRSLDTLTALQREVLELVYFQDLTQKGVAAHLGVPLGTVKSRVSSALDALRRYHESDGTNPTQGARAHRGRRPGYSGDTALPG